MRLRFRSIACGEHALAAFALLCAGQAAFAQTTPGTSARIDDIQLSRNGETVSILVKLSHQPLAATAKASGDSLVLTVDGVSLASLALDPRPGALLQHLEASGDTLTVSGAAFGETSTVIYRNAVLIEAKLAEPALLGASLLSAPASVPSALDLKPVREPDTNGSQPISLVPTSSASASAKIPTGPIPTTEPDPTHCAAAASAVEKDAWSVPSLGDHALCLIGAGRTVEAMTRLDQLAAFAPEDPRIAQARAALATKTAAIP